MSQVVTASWNLSDGRKIKDVANTAKLGIVPVFHVVAVVEGARSGVSGKRSPIVQMFRR